MVPSDCVISSYSEGGMESVYDGREVGKVCMMIISNTPSFPRSSQVSDSPGSVAKKIH